MSCGNHHETPCSEVLDRVYEFIDDELPTADCAKIKHHLEECGPCLREFGIEEEVKSVVKRSCSDPAPESLRVKVLMRIREVQVELAPEGL